MRASETVDLRELSIEAQALDGHANLVRRRMQALALAEDLGSGVSLTMVLVPDGVFQMGTAPTEDGHYAREGPRHQVHVSAFLMSSTEVTRDQWRAVAALPQIERRLDPQPSGSVEGNRPVDHVSWNDAVEFCARLTVKTGRSYRLPTEAEWEYAARAGTEGPFSFGVNFRQDLANCAGKQTWDVGASYANAFGLRDMHGNVWEWTQDSAHDAYDGAPADGRAWINSNNKRRVLRGGSWRYPGRICRSAYRAFSVPELRSDDVGFRPVVAIAALRPDRD